MHEAPKTEHVLDLAVAEAWRELKPGQQIEAIQLLFTELILLLDEQGEAWMEAFLDSVNEQNEAVGQFLLRVGEISLIRETELN